ncbi:transketolase [Pseudohongiella nitratireducens]|uniref:Transketolase n=1 Tax=Pseudohongiella nitratireducens TaxID=1768907 RepID=A0A917LVB9_9GAMM|nr:transketolase [Pseudohongiella nitratireducens]MDF1621993.1 transketolase [Pseudohongiella nitratireducens]GGG59833.1 transketolase [Pseudohongiella nitratireducens]
MSTRQTTRRERANAIRALSMDAVQKANSGHPGAPMGMADIAEVLWNDYLSHNPVNPQWINRDRFILSNGHGSMLVYSLLHLSGYDLPISELQNFRQLHSRTPGHPEYGYTPGVETTTGPLGQGLANGVGMAIAEKTLAAQFNRPDHDIIDHFTYVFAGDGCLMEGVSHEVSSLAGTLGLGKLVVFYDDNGISIDGEVQGWFTDDTTKRFESYGWQVLAVDGHDAEQINEAIKSARAETSRPTLIRCKTVIGFGSPGKSGTSGIHGAPLGAEEIEATRKELGWEHAPFEVPEAIQNDWDARERGFQAESSWKERMTRYEEAYPELAVELVRRLKGELPGDFAAKADEVVAKFNAAEESLATRKASQNAIAAFNEVLPELLGGSADLTGSNLTMWSGSQPVSADKADGNYIYYGVREFGMSAIMNGIALHGGFIPYGGTFLIFMEYARNAVRMGALMKQQVINVYTHDSIGQGEDGPTHQPVEQLSNLRTTPNMAVWRPSDAVETAVAWKHALLRSDGPTSLVFSRQGLPHQGRNAEQLQNIERGGYVLEDCEGTPDIIVLATGSEVSIARDAVKTLHQDGVAARLVAMPSVEYFLAQDADYREQVLPAQVRRRLAVEAGAADYWYKFVGLDGDVIGMTTFGESAPGSALMKEFGFTPENIVNRAKALLSNG